MKINELKKENELLRNQIQEQQEKLNNPPKEKKTSVYLIKYRFSQIIEGKKRNFTSKVAVEGRTKQDALKEFTKRINGVPVECERLVLKEK